MRIAIIAVTVVVIGLLQLTYPAVLAPLNAVPDIALLLALSMALYYKPRSHVLWWVGLAGLMVDLWQPSHFGVWIAACLSVAAVTIAAQSRVLPRLTQPGAFATGAVALLIGVVVLAIGNSIGISLGASVANFGRLFLLKYVVDLALAIPVLWLTRQLAISLRLQPAGPGSVGSSGGGTQIVVKV